MSRFKKNDTVFFVGSKQSGIVTDVRERDLATFYQVNNEPTWVPSRLLWDGDESEKRAFCSQLTCQRELLLTKLEKGVDYILDKYGFPMCKAHQDEEQWA